MQQSPPHVVRKKAIDITLALYRVTDSLPRDEALFRYLRERGLDVLDCLLEWCSIIEEGSFGWSIDALRVKIEKVSGLLSIVGGLGVIKVVNIQVLQREYGNLFEVLEGSSRVGVRGGLRGTNISGTGGNSRGGNMVETGYSRMAPRRLKTPSQDIFSGVVSHVKKKQGPRNTYNLSNGSSTEDNDHAVSTGVNERQKVILGQVAEKQLVKVSDFYELFRGMSTKTIQRDLQDLVLKRLLKKDGEKRWTVYSMV